MTTQPGAQRPRRLVVVGGVTAALLVLAVADAAHRFVGSVGSDCLGGAALVGVVATVLVALSARSAAHEASMEAAARMTLDLLADPASHRGAHEGGTGDDGGADDGGAGAPPAADLAAAADTLVDTGRPAGWYRDPDHPWLRRSWDGLTWSETYAPTQTPRAEP